jgi:hypothetical protein
LSEVTPEELFGFTFKINENLRMGKTDEILAAEESGTAWAKHFFPNLFSRPFTAYQSEFWEWGWGIEPEQVYRPRVECEPRGVGKSTNAEAWVVSMVARQKRKMIGYVSLNETKATKHFESIKSMLESDALLTAYPHCKPRIQKLRDTSQQWSREAIVMDSGAMIVPLTLLGSSRGWKSSEGSRFDVIVLDDIDELGQTPEYTKKLIEMLKGEILAAGYDKTVVLMPQNLIYRDSICSQIHDQRADILSNRIFCGPYPLLKWYDAEKVDIPGDTTGAKEWVITAGEAFDPAIDLVYATSLLNTYGKAMFDRECQQLVTQIEDDKDFREWSEIYHLVTYSEFRSVMESLGEPVWNDRRKRLQVPQRWNVGLGFDWGTTKGHPSAVAIVARPSEICPLKNSHFVVSEVVKPDFPIDSHETPELVSPGRVAVAIQDELREWNIEESQIQMRLMSHEASAAMNTMAIDLKPDIQQFFGKWKAQKGSGVPQIQNLLEIDHTKPHPFRKYPEGYTKDGINLGGQPLMGAPRLYFLVEDDQGELRTDLLNNLYVSGPKDADGFARARFEMPIYSHRNTSDAKKIDDDFVDAFRGLMNVFGVESTSKTYGEVAQEKYEATTVYARPEHKDDHSIGAQMSRAMAVSKVLKQMKDEGYDLDEDESGFSGIDLNGGY